MTRVFSTYCAVAPSPIFPDLCSELAFFRKAGQQGTGNPYEGTLDGLWGQEEPREQAAAEIESTEVTMPVTRIGVHGKHPAPRHHEELERRLLEEWRATPSEFPRPDIVEESDGSKTVHAFVIWDEWKNLSPEERTEVILNGYEQFYGEIPAKELSVAMGLTSHEAQGLGMSEIRLFPTLDRVDPMAFAQQTRELAEMYGDTDLDTVVERALLLAEYAQKGKGIEKGYVEEVAEDLAYRIDYSPIDTAPEDKIGIVLIGAVARARILMGERVTAKELHVLASLSRKTREHIDTDGVGFVHNEDAREYLEAQGVDL